MSADAITTIAGISKLTKADLDGLQTLDPTTLALVMQNYIDNDAVADHGVWVAIGQALQASAPYFALGAAILGVASPIAALLKI